MASCNDDFLLPRRIECNSPQDCSEVLVGLGQNLKGSLSPFQKLQWRWNSSRRGDRTGVREGHACGITTFSAEMGGGVLPCIELGRSLLVLPRPELWLVHVVSLTMPLVLGSQPGGSPWVWCNEVGSGPGWGRQVAPCTINGRRQTWISLQTHAPNQNAAHSNLAQPPVNHFGGSLKQGIEPTTPLATPATWPPSFPINTECINYYYYLDIQESQLKQWAHTLAHNHRINFFFNPNTGIFWLSVAFNNYKVTILCLIAAQPLPPVCYVVFLYAPAKQPDSITVFCYFILLPIDVTIHPIHKWPRCWSSCGKGWFTKTNLNDS